MLFKKQSSLKQLLTESNKAKILDAIRRAELNTSGEIRLHIEPKLKGSSALDRAADVFYELGMHQTAQRNGVLVYVALDDRQFAILGDEGIHAHVGADFWETEKDAMTAYFKRGELIEGMAYAIEQVGEKLKQYFPYQQGDVNELRDDISIGGTEE